MPIISIVNLPSDQRGFTLVEALIAIFILIVGIVSLYTMQIGAIHGNARANSIAQIATWGTGRIEETLIRGNKSEELTNIAGIGANCDPAGTGIDIPPQRQCGLNNPLQATGQEPNYQALGWTCPPYLAGGAVAWPAGDCKPSQDGRGLIFINVANNMPARNITTIRVKTVTMDFGQPVVTTTTYFKSNLQ